MNDDCYDHPKYWDLSFQSETPYEADFIEAALVRYATGDGKRLFEPGCGGGRLVVEMASRGYDLTAIDLNQNSVDYARKQLAERGCAGDVQVGDMREFAFAASFDAAFCTYNTFRHLISEADAVAHLQCIAGSLRPGGIYILGFHLIPLDADEEDEESWSEQRDGIRVTNRLEVVQFDRSTRIERLRFTLDIDDAGRTFQITAEYPYRLYLHTEFLATLAAVPELELVEVYDFNFDIDDPVPLDGELSDAVFVLRRRAV